MSVDDANRTVLTAPVNAVVQAAQQLGADAEAILRAAGIEPHLLQQADARIPVEQFFKLYALAEQTTGHEDIGLIVGRIVYLKGLNLQLYMTTVCHSFRDYLNLMPSVLKLLGDLGEVVMRRETDTICLEWVPLLPESRVQRYLSDEMLAASAAIVDSLCTLPIPVQRAHFSYPQPGDTHALQRVFGSALAFDQPVSCLYFDANVLDYALIQQDYPLESRTIGMLSRLVEGTEPPDNFASRLRQSIVRLLPEGEVSVDAVAGDLNLSRRTLQRRLADRDTHFLQILQEVRSELARGYLGDKRLAITEIAFLLGYADQGSFSSAFKGWFGVSPSEFRSTGGANGGGITA